LAALLLSLLILGKVFHSYHWLTVWDATTDPLGVIWLIFLIPAAIFSGMLLAIISPFKPKLVGFGYALVIAATLIAVFTQAQRVDFRRLTEQRAEQVKLAIDRFYAREGDYPQNLRQLIPRDTFLLPEPIVIFGQDWCYQGVMSFIV